MIFLLVGFFVAVYIVACLFAMFLPKDKKGGDKDE